MIRYAAAGVPAHGSTAFMPAPAASPERECGGLVHVTGSPGTTAVAFERPEAVWAPPISADHRTQPSEAGPAHMLPTVYVARMDHMGTRSPSAVESGVNSAHSGQVPEPAVSPNKPIVPRGFAGRSVGGTTVTPAIPTQDCAWNVFGGGTQNG